MPRWKQIDNSYYELPNSTFELSCFKYWHVYYQCVTLGGIFTGLYREGRPMTCELENENFWECMKHTVRPSEDGNQALRQINKERREKLEEFNSLHVW
eukprot:CAMPEP_0201488438 /NCGR_PEP_ID=MMETSP0151_2-20130828/18200_1 /ASSEMBLY_ACC=CAM_ASM_000257 /TAXON_ID=200890 /ORGANISM="Paramoeba atlantica, Strain 621/1 / CCAP 1560/9" /LENGTH=97 /DNA_ID=CAMNT_0047873725 /DNA_START=64 /DNA_END=354 /DNA_ORIENTATION=+